MPGLYIHIPFCRKACHYCNFHFSTTLDRQEEMVQGIATEISLRADYLENKPVETIYFGGGTPSLLHSGQLERIFEAIHASFVIAPGAEITLEANPDDLTEEKLKQLASTPINRLSIGVQSFFDEDLHWMNRVHSANIAEAAILRAQDLGFHNLTIDLIYGVPGLTDERWMANLQKAADLGIPHLSAYCLTVEPGTALSRMIEKGKVPDPDTEQGARQFEILISHMEDRGFEQYEISNFARDGRYAIHNTNYWNGKTYLGAGPSAHSYNGGSRSWNIANNNLYMKGIAAGMPAIETEILSDANKFNEYMMTGLRTKWGCDLQYLSEKFPDQYASIRSGIDKLQESDLLITVNNKLLLTQRAKLMADRIASDLFV